MVISQFGSFIVSDHTNVRYRKMSCRLSHMLKEVNASANVVCEEPEQVVHTLPYVIRGELPPPKDGDLFVPIADRLGKGNPNP
jgi:hypothetical protein